MTTGEIPGAVSASGTSSAGAKLFVRNATGLVRSWATFDAFLYSYFSINIVSLGFFAFAYGYLFPGGNLITAIIVSGVFILFEVLVYAALISVMPRAGGDYVWQTRVLGGAIGFTLAATGWIFILWLWVPIYGNVLAVEFTGPLFAVLGDWTGNHTFIDWSVNSTTQGGIMLSSVLVAVFATIVIALGMKVYARVQKFCFYVGGLGLLTFFVVLLFADHSSFVSGFNHYSSVLKGNSYAATLAAGKTAGVVPIFSKIAFAGSFALIPIILFFNLYPNWGATLYGEVRGAGDFKRNVRAMGYSVIVNTALAVLALVLLAKVMTDTFFNSANALAGVPAPLTYPGMLAAFTATNHLLQLWLVVSLSMFFWGWCGTVFLSSSRVVFAVAFDRVIPEWFSKVAKNGAPINALITMLVPGLILSVLYSYQIWSFQTLVLDATLVIAVTFLGSTIAAILLPWRQKDAYNGSPIAKYQIAGVPMISIAGVVFAGFLIWSLYKWLQDATYGLNSHTSLVFLGILYLGSVLIYVGSRIIRKREGVDLSAIHQEIPVE
jgi:APA family basic amino acid/polyamine antiporter